MFSDVACSAYNDAPEQNLEVPKVGQPKREALKIRVWVMEPNFERKRD